MDINPNEEIAGNNEYKVKQMKYEDLPKPDDHFRIEFGASFSDLEEGEVMLVATDRRDAKRFADYLLPLWFARKDDKCIISVSPKRRSLTESVFERATPEEIFSKERIRQGGSFGRSHRWLHPQSWAISL